MSSSDATRAPRWYGIPLRVALVTFLGTLISFAVSLFFGILATVILASLRRERPDMRVAYRHIALPVAIVVGVIVFIAALMTEIRRYRESKALLAIEKMN